MDLGDGHDVCLCTVLISKESIVGVELSSSQVYIGAIQPYGTSLGGYSVLVKRHRPVMKWILKKHSTIAQPLTVRGRRSLKLALVWDGTAGRGWKADERA